LSINHLLILGMRLDKVLAGDWEDTIAKYEKRRERK